MLECRLAVVFGFIFRNKDGIAGCAVAQHCFNDDQQSQWENGDFDPCRSETPENFITKIGHIDYVAGATRMPNFMGIGLGCPPHK